MPPHSSYPIPISSGGELTVYRRNSPLLTRHRRLCSVLERLAAGDPSRRGEFHGMPWFTPIVGSGCLELGDGPSVDIAAIGPIARAGLEQLGIRFPRELGDPGLIALGFAEALQRSRTHTGDPPASPRLITPSMTAARLAVLTSLLTRLFHGACMSVPSPTSRWWAKERAELAGSTPNDVFLRDTVLPTIAALIEAMTNDTLGGGSSTAEVARRALLRNISDRLDRRPPGVFIEDLRLITELTWLEMIKDTSIYPGWSDLLLELLMRYSNAALNAPVGYRPKVPELAQLGDEVARLLARPTERSWGSRLDSSRPQERDAFYSAIAHLLHAQADLFQLMHSRDPLDVDEEAIDPVEYEAMGTRAARSVEIRKRVLEDTGAKRGRVVGSLPSIEVPHPVAFVTSFDLEMEMALSASGRPYRVVVPILSKSSRRTQADLVWLSATVDPSMDTQSARTNTRKGLTDGPHDWRIAQEVLRPGEGGEYPVVIRLSGCPLLTLPAVTGLLLDDFLNLDYKKGERISLFHALTIDEYTSLRQSENELFFAARQEARGLPGCLSSGTDSNDRVWVGFGVQIDDPAIRARMFSQLSAGSLIRRTNRHARLRTEDASAGDMEADATDHIAVRGLAVNQRIDEDEATALHWLGFHFALEVNSGSLIRDIDHCAEHVSRVVTQAAALAPEATRLADETTDANWERPDDGSCLLWTSPQGGGG